MVNDEIKKINEENSASPYRSNTKYTLADLAGNLNYDSAYLYRILHLNDEGMPLRRISLFDVVRIIVVLRPPISRAEEMIHRAGYNIDYDCDCNTAKYRSIINLTSNDVEDYNKRLRKITLTDSRRFEAKDVVNFLERPMGQHE